jgi:hypothetical protein
LYEQSKLLPEKEEVGCVDCNKVFIRDQKHQKHCYTEECINQKKVAIEQNRWLNKKERPRQKNSFSAFSYVSRDLYKNYDFEKKRK